MNVAMSAETHIDYGFERYCVDRRDERLIGPHGPIKLGNKAFQVLLKLIEQGGRLVTKDALMSSVWDGTIVSEFSLTSAIKELRRALGDDARAPRFIESVYGRGYRFLTPIDEIDGKRRPAASLHGLDPPARARLPVGCNDVADPAGEPSETVPVQGEGGRGFPVRLRSLRGHVVAAAILASSLLAFAPTGLDRISGAARTAPPVTQAVAPAGSATLVVLPFEDLDGDKDAQLLRGIEEQVIDRLAGAPGLRVTGRTVANALGTDAGLADAHRQLGLTHLLEGNVRGDGGTLRVTIRLLRANDGTQLWSDRFDLPGADGETIERDVGQAVAARVRERFQRETS